MFGWELTDEEMGELDALDESETRIPAEGKNPEGLMKRKGSVSWGGSVVEWRKGDGSV